MDVVEGMVATVGPLLGVGVGGWLTQLQLARGWRQEQSRQARTERLAVYARFMAGARSWQAAVLAPDARIVTAHPDAPYADAGPAFGETIRALAELRLVAGQDVTVTEAAAWEQSLRALSEARASAHPGPAPTAVLQQVRVCEEAFVAAARRELAVRG